MLGGYVSLSRIGPFKDIQDILLYLLILSGVFVLATLWLYGVVWISEKLYPSPESGAGDSGSGSLPSPPYGFFPKDSSLVRIRHDCRLLHHRAQLVGIIRPGYHKNMGNRRLSHWSATERRYRCSGRLSC